VTSVNRAWARLCRAAWIAVATHALAGLAMLLVLQQGLETNPDLDARLRFLAEQRAAWIAAWLTWNAAALSILYFCVAFASAHRSEANQTALAFAVALCSAAIACDLGAESILMGLLPELAGDRGRFLVWERAAVLLSGYVANGLYTVAIGTLWWSTRKAYASTALAAGLLTCLAGLTLSAAALAGSVSGMFWSNAVLLPGLLVWLAAVGRDAWRRASADRT
jgi:hypothetical protein